MYRDGTLHHGEFKNHRICGPGTRFYPPGSEFKVRRGVFVETSNKTAIEDVLMKEEGEVWFTNGEYCSGVFKEDDLNGKGDYFYANIESQPTFLRYKGDFKDGYSEGFGRLLYRNGDEYSGAFSEDEPHGKGVLRRHDGRVLFGEFDGGCPVRGTLTDRARRRYLVQYDGKINSAEVHRRRALPRALRRLRLSLTFLGGTKCVDVSCAESVSYVSCSMS